MTKSINILFFQMLALMIILFGARQAQSDVLAEFLFWDSLGKSAGQAVKSHNDYQRERQLWKDKIDKAKRHLAECNGCASAQAELDKWQGIENQFQQVAGTMAQAVGMPPVVVKWLGIDMPPFSAMTSPRYGADQIVVGDWIGQRSESCQIAAKSHLGCLKSYLKDYGSYAEVQLISPGHRCYPSNKLYQLCFQEDYAGFERESRLQSARATGNIIPEYVTDGRETTIYYGDVPDSFSPTLLPPKVINMKLEENKKQTGSVAIIMEKSGTGFLDAVRYKYFFWNEIPHKTNCFSGRPARSEEEQRVCEDFKTLNWELDPPILICYYTLEGGTRTRNHDYSMYWFGERPEIASPKRLSARASWHPILQIGEPRTECPLTKTADRFKDH